MNQQAQQRLIRNLTAELSPVRRLAKPTTVVIGLFLGSMISAVLILLFMFGHRPEPPADIDRVLSLINEVGSLTAIVAIAFCLSLMRIPGLETAWVRKLSSFVFISTTLFLMVVDALTGKHIVSFTPNEMACTFRLLLISLPAGALAAIVAKRGAPSSVQQAAVACAAFAVAVGAFTLPIVCDNAEAAHVAVFHFALPLFFFFALFSLLARRLFRW
jgi:hypothetical protein